MLSVKKRGINLSKRCTVGRSTTGSTSYCAHWECCGTASNRSTSSTNERNTAGTCITRSTEPCWNTLRVQGVSTTVSDPEILRVRKYPQYWMSKFPRVPAVSPIHTPVIFRVHEVPAAFSLEKGLPSSQLLGASAQAFYCFGRILLFSLFAIQKLAYCVKRHHEASADDVQQQQRYSIDWCGTVGSSTGRRTAAAGTGHIHRYTGSRGVYIGHDW